MTQYEEKHQSNTPHQQGADVIPLIYIDQTIVSLQAKGIIDLSKRKNIKWAYSKEHFSEIRRSNNPNQYLDALKSINAKLLDLCMEDFKLTGHASLTENVSPEELYHQYLETRSEVPFDEGIFDPLLAWGNGGGSIESLRDMPEKYQAQLDSLTHPISSDAKDDLSSSIETMINNGNDIEKMRATLGGWKGAFGTIKGENQLQKIWNIIKPLLRDQPITSDQFFGFDPPFKFGYESIPLYLGICSCCSVLDILGFQAEQKSRKIDKIPNIRSDASHIGMGSYCNAIISADKRFSARAKAIYQYKGLPTVSLRAERAA